MPAKGKHRRPTSRRLVRGFVAAGTGGAALALPLFGVTTAGAAQPAQAATVQAAGTAPVAAKKAPVTYTVVAGDSLSKIAEEQSVSGGWKKLYNDNRRNIGADPALIRPGLKLTIGAKAAPADRAADAGRADRSAARPAAAKKAPAAKPATAKKYSNDLDGWIKESLDIMAKHGIPGTYEGIHRNIMRESSGNPLAINNWDINAQNGTPSKGLLQVIDPTFRAYHVPGTPFDSYDPVANITAACNYAAARYGSIDNVNGPY
ncbi:LysM peptidoglycan-binding domain-containing protein [Streptomyces sp. 5K101]|uniref:LysM peptidoglycan-binding domain-containing protein n=1 Tax=Streptomyces sp. 5K101 TaxID=3390037 RepID=UPI003974DE79